MNNKEERRRRLEKETDKNKQDQLSLVKCSLE
jgi:hypothetical protein